MDEEWYFEYEKSPKRACAERVTDIEHALLRQMMEEGM